MDKHEQMWKQQESFMKLLQSRRDFPVFPVDITTKNGQKILKSITHECMHELFEANTALKNSKDHRATDVSDFDRDGYVEELCDALHYFFEILIFSGVSMEDLFSAYMKKGEINFKRIEQGY